MEQHSRSNFSGYIGFILAAAGSAVGLGNIWRFPYLAAKNGGGLFLLVYIILAVTFGFALLTTEIAIGRRTAKGPLAAYKMIHPKWGFLGIIATIVPAIILPYYNAIGGWIVKYFRTFLGGELSTAASDGFFTGFITSEYEPLLWMLIFLFVSAIIVFSGVNKGIERTSKFIMPILLAMIIGISIFSVFLQNTDADGTTRTGIDGLLIYIIPDVSGMGFWDIVSVVLDAMGQLFFSISVAMGIMVAYGSYVKKEVNLVQGVNHIEFFDTVVAIIAGLMIIPAVYTFLGQEGLESAGPGLIFVALPKVFVQMGAAGSVVAVIFFALVLFAALTSNVSIMEAVVSSLMDTFKISRNKAASLTTIWGGIIGVIVCKGYNALYFELPLPNGSVAQILDVMDYASNSILMPILALLTCILIGWVVGPKYIVDEVTNNGTIKFGRQKLYIAMVKFIAPVLLVILLLRAFGVA